MFEGNHIPLFYTDVTTYPCPNPDPLYNSPNIISLSFNLKYPMVVTMKNIFLINQDGYFYISVIKFTDQIVKIYIKHL